MSQYGEPWLWGFWVLEKKPDRTQWYVFRDSGDPRACATPELWGNVKYGDEVHCTAFDNGKHPHLRIVYESSDYYGGTQYDDDVLDRGVACVNALAGIPSPSGIPGLIAAVTKILQACHEAKAHGWEDHTNFTQTLETAMEGCYLTPPPASVP